MAEKVDHPQHYGGDTTYEHIKVVEAWGLNYALGNATKYICRAGKKENELEDLRKAAWYLQHEIDRVERETEHNRRLRAVTTLINLDAPILPPGIQSISYANPCGEVQEITTVQESGETTTKVMKREKPLFDGLLPEEHRVPLRETLCTVTGCLAERKTGSKYCTAHYGLHKEE